MWLINGVLFIHRIVCLTSHKKDNSETVCVYSSPFIIDEIVQRAPSAICIFVILFCLFVICLFVCLFVWLGLDPGSFYPCPLWLFHCNRDTWWRHQMKTFSALLAICAGNLSVPGEFPAQRPVTRSFGVFFDLRLNKRLWSNIPYALKIDYNFIPKQSTTQPCAYSMRNFCKCTFYLEISAFRDVHQVTASYSLSALMANRVYL